MPKGKGTYGSKKGRPAKKKGKRNSVARGGVKGRIAPKSRARTQARSKKRRLNPRPPRRP